MTENYLDIDFSFKKNNVDELFFNLSENPEGFKNKDFRYTLSLIYQTSRRCVFLVRPSMRSKRSTLKLRSLKRWKKP